MRIGIVSDTHGSLHYLNKALEAIGSCDYIIHAGDILYHGPRNPLPEGYSPKDVAETLNGLNNIYFVSGNCDGDVDQMVIKHPIQSPYTVMHIGGIKIMVCHGYKEPLDDTVAYAKSCGFDLFVYGHTHVKELRKDEDLVVLNPGSTSLPKDSFHSVAVIEDSTIRLIDILSGDMLGELKI